MRRSGWLVLAGIAGLAAGCGGGGGGAARDVAVNTGLDQLAGKTPPAPGGDVSAAGPTGSAATPKKPEPGSLEALAEQSAVNLQNVLDEMAQDKGGATGKVIPPAPIDPAAAEKARLASEAAKPKPAPPKEETLAIPPTPASDKPLKERIDEGALALVDLVRQQAASGVDARHAYVALAGLEALSPGASGQTITPQSLGGDAMSSDDRAVVDGVRDLITALAGAPAGKSFPLLVRDLADRVTMNVPVRIGTAVLCSRVSAFGKFAPLSSTKLLQGRPQRAIVYVEVTSFGQRQVTEAEAAQWAESGWDGRPKWAVDLSQKLELYHDADGVLAWGKPEEGVIETSMNRRRDFYLVQQITLPSTLTVGAYRLKVALKDRATGTQDEAVIPIEVVADPGLALEKE